MGTKSFTLVELLIVIGILAILTAAVVVVLNPAELLKQARDSKRLQDLTSIDQSLSVSQAIYPDISLGTASTVYVSIADTTSTCANLGLPSLPGGWSYACVTAANLINSDGTGWIPVNFQDTNLVGAIQMSALPIDPTNTVSTGLYYTYTPGGSYEINGILESDKYRNDTKVIKENLPGVVSKGTDTALSPIYNNSGLVGYWDFEEGNGTTTADKSGNGSTGTLTNGPTWVDGKVGSYAIDFNAGDDNVIFSSDPVGTTAITVVAWMYADTLGDANYGQIMNNGKLGFAVRPGNRTYGYNDGYTIYLVLPGYNNTFSLDQWALVAYIRDSAGTNCGLYVDGAATGPLDQNGGVPEVGSTSLYVGNGATFSNGFDGVLDDVRIYNRVLSESEMLAIYNATR